MSVSWFSPRLLWREIAGPEQIADLIFARFKRCRFLRHFTCQARRRHLRRAADRVSIQKLQNTDHGQRELMKHFWLSRHWILYPHYRTLFFIGLWFALIGTDFKPELFTNRMNWFQNSVFLWIFSSPIIRSRDRNFFLKIISYTLRCVRRAVAWVILVKQFLAISRIWENLHPKFFLQKVSGSKYSNLKVIVATCN